MERYTIYKEKVYSTKTKKYKTRYSVRFFENGLALKTKRLKATNRTEAQKEVDELLLNKKNDKDPLALDYILDFWDISQEKGIYSTRKAQGRPISEMYVKINYCVAKKHIEPYLKNTKIHDLNLGKMKEILLSLKKSGVSNRTIQNVISAVKLPVKTYFLDRGQSNPLQLLTKGQWFYEEKKRGTLTLHEIEKIIALKKEESPRVITAILLGCLCGLRLGEVCGLLWEDIDLEKNEITVRHNWTENKIKKPKAGSFRRVAIPEALKESLLLCRGIKPSSMFVLWNEKNKNHPFDKASIQTGFKRILRKIGIKESDRQERNLVFHSLRHTFVTLLREELSPFAVQKLAGHKSIEMTERYSDHSTVNLEEHKNYFDKVLKEVNNAV